MDFAYIFFIEPLVWTLSLGVLIGGMIGGLVQRPRTAFKISIVYGLVTAFVGGAWFFVVGAGYFIVGANFGAAGDASEIFNLTGLVIFLGLFVVAFLMHGLPVVLATRVTCRLLGKRTK